MYEQRPYIYFSAPIFLLYELSSPFLNIHWFCDKLDLTGSTLQAINGVFLVGTFFGCRIVWGIWNSILVFADMYNLVMAGHTNFARQVPRGKIMTYSTKELLEISKDPVKQLDAFNHERYIPLWIPLIYLASNLVLNSLNVYWFGKMIETIRTRFPPPYGTMGTADGKGAYTTQKESSGEDGSGSDSGESVDSDLGVGAPGKDKHEYHRRESISSGKAVAKKGRKPKRVADGGAKVEKKEGAGGGVAVEVSGSTRKSGRRRKA